MNHQCVICRRPGNALDVDGWEPFYGDVTVDKDPDGPVCPGCRDKHLEYLDGYFQLPPDETRRLVVDAFLALSPEDRRLVLLGLQALRE